MSQILALSPAAWYRWNVGITVATGVSAWADQSGNGRDLLQATAGAQPAKQADGSILFDGVAQLLQATFTLNGPQSIFLLGQQVTWTGDDVIFDGKTDISMMLQQYTTGGTPFVNMRNTTGNGTAGNNGTWPLATDAVVSCIFGASVMSLQVNNSAATTVAIATSAAAGFTLGGRGAATTLFGNIKVKEVIILPIEVDSVTRLKIARYLGKLGGISF